MKVAAYLLGLGVLAAGVSFGVAGIEAQQSTLMNFCPAGASSTNCSAAATMLVSAGNPSDDELVAYITAISGAQHASRGCADTAAGLQALADAIDSKATRALAQQVVDRLCGTTRTSVGSADIGTFYEETYGLQNNVAAGFNSSPTVVAQTATNCGQSSGSNGQSSGSSGQTSSGASGNTSSGASSGASGTSGQSSGSSCN